MFSTKESPIMGSPYATDYTYDGEPGESRGPFPTDYTIKDVPAVDDEAPAEEAPEEPEA